MHDCCDILYQQSIKRSGNRKFYCRTTFSGSFKLARKRSFVASMEFSLGEGEAFKLPINELGIRLKTNLETGLPQEAADERLLRVGPNAVPKVASSRMKM